MAQANVKAVITADDRASRVLGKFASNVQSASKRLLKLTAAFGGAAAVIGIKTAADLETARQSFIALLGTAERADKTIDRIKKEATRTPFEVKGLVTATQLLSQVTKDGDKSIDILLDVGEALAFAGKGQAELDRVIINLQQIANTGKITALDLKQFGFAGINIAEVLAEHFGTTKEAAMDMIKTSDDAFGDLTAAFKSATDEGGRFSGAFAAQGGTFNQVLSNLKDAFQLAMADIVKNVGLFEGVKSVIAEAGDFISENTDSIVDSLNNFVSFIRDSAITALDILKGAFDILKPSLEAVWNSIKNDLMPALINLWENTLKPLIPVIGVAFVGVLVATLDVLNFLIPIVASITEFLAEHEVILWTVIGAWAAWKTAMMITGVVNAINGAIVALGSGAQVATLKTIGLKNVLTSMSLPVVGSFALVGAAAAAAYLLVRNEAEKTKKVLDDLADTSEKAFDSDMLAIKKAQELKAQGKDKEAEAILASFRNRSGAFSANQLGGNVTSGRASIVGEGSGNPEVFIPSRSGRVEPLDGISGGGSINLNVNIGLYSGTGVERRKIAENIMESLREIASAKGMSVGELLA